MTLVRLGHQLSLAMADEKQVALRDVWRSLVVPMEIGMRLVSDE